MKLAPLIISLALGLDAIAQSAPLTVAPATPVPPWQMSPEERQHLQRLSHEDHSDMLRQLGIQKLRPGRNGSTAPGTVNPANYDETLANTFPDWPERIASKPFSNSV